MNAKVLAKRVAIDLAVVLLFVVAAGGFFWLRFKQERAKRDKRVSATLQDEETLRQRLDSLGSLDLQPNGLT